MMDYGLKGADFWKLNWSPGKCFCLLWKMGNISAALEGYNLENNFLLISFSFRLFFFFFFKVGSLQALLLSWENRWWNRRGISHADKHELIPTYGYKALTPPFVTYSAGDVTSPARGSAPPSKNRKAKHIIAYERMGISRQDPAEPCNRLLHVSVPHSCSFSKRFCVKSKDENLQRVSYSLPLPGNPFAPEKYGVNGRLRAQEPPTITCIPRVQTIDSSAGRSYLNTTAN